MKAFILDGVYNLDRDTEPLRLTDVPKPVPASGEILIKVSCCGVCHTELDEIEGRTPPLEYPVIPGHQVIGTVELCGIGSTRFKVGTRIGVAWINSACGECSFCKSGLENLCAEFRATGRDANGGYAEYICVKESFAYSIPEIFSDEEAAPFLCAGAIGYRSLMLAGISDGDTLALTGFGASGHLVLKSAKALYPKSKVFVFARNAEEREFALSLGASWAGDTTETPPELIQAAIETTPAWKPVVSILKHLLPGGRMVINVIRKEERDKEVLQSLSYTDHLWMEKEIKSVANITRRDVTEFLELAAKIPIKPVIETYPFKSANQAILDLKQKHIRGAKVLVM